MFGQGNDVTAHRCHQMVNLEINVTTHRTGSQLARPNMGGVMGKVPLCVRKRDELMASTSLMQNTPSHMKRDPHCTIEGWLHTLIVWNESMTTTKRNWN